MSVHPLMHDALEAEIASLERAALEAACARREHEHTFNSDTMADDEGDEYRAYRAQHYGLTETEDAALDALLAARAKEKA